MLTNTLFKTLITEYASTTEIINIDTFDNYLRSLELRNEYHEHNVNKIKGSIFEYISKYYYLSKNFEVYLFGEIPSKLRNTLQLGRVDYGIDLIYKDNDKWIPVQSKWRKESQYNKKTVHKDQLLGFIEESNRHNFDKKVVFTNVQNTNAYIQKVYELDWILRENLKGIINKEFINFILSNLQIKQIIEKPKQVNLRGYQYDALLSLLQSEENRKQCIMYCGTGKSMVMYRYINTKKPNKVIIFMPSLQLINQFYNSLKNDMLTNSVEYITDNILCICSRLDVKDFAEEHITYTTDENIIGQKMENDKIIVLCTYQSSKLVKNLTFDMGLFDEAHKTVNNDTFGFALDNNNCKINERVFFTATPKYYSGKNDECIAMNNEEIYGKEVFNYSFQKAKQEENVLDFQIITYVVPENMENLVNEKYIKKDNLNVSSENVISAIMMAQQISMSNNCKKILTYHNTINNAIEYKKTLEYIFLKFNIKAKVFVIWGDTKMDRRKEMIEEFESSEIAVICSSKVLGEGIDIPCTDTVTFVDPRSSEIDVTQCVGRGQRLYRSQKMCNVIIPVHYDQIDKKHNYRDLLNILGALNDVDNKIIENFVKGNENNRIKVVNLGENFIDTCNFDIKYDIDMIMENLECVIGESRILGFDYKMNLLFKYCNENKCTPKKGERYENYNIAMWLSDQKKKINNVDDELYKKLSANEYIKNNLNEYLKYLEINEGKIKLEFSEWLQLLFKYCDENKCVPQARTKYENQNIGKWFLYQRDKINNADDELYKTLSVNEHIKILLDEYIKHIEEKEDLVKLSQEQYQQLLFTYCDENKCIPEFKIKYENQDIGKWLRNQKYKINSIDDILYKNLSKNVYVKKHLDEYLNANNKWNESQQLLFKFCNENKRVPQCREKYEDYSIGVWLQTQKVHINSIDDELYIKLSVNEYVKINLDNYLKYIEENKDIEKLSWEQWQQLLFKYCNENKCYPQSKIRYENRNIGEWLGYQKTKINSVEDDLYKKLSINEYVKKNLDEYLNPDNKWNEWQRLLFNYCNENKRCPTRTTIYENQHIGIWLCAQKGKLNNVNDEIYKKLSVNEYVKKNLDEYLDPNSSWDKWNQWKQLLFKYCDENKCCPSYDIKYENKNIGQWLNSQKIKINNFDDKLYKELSVNDYVKKGLDKKLNKNKS